ncbi:MAG: hypothetical protein QE265_04860 [Rhodoferax sp.]|nr:hypothetical protein [Rhodoferax sp.]
MARITLVLEDTPAGGVSVRTNYHPAVGSKCSLAQSAALEIMSRTARDYGLPPSFGATPVHGVDIDAVHRTRDNVIDASGSDL